MSGLTELLLPLLLLLALFSFLWLTLHRVFRKRLQREHWEGEGFGPEQLSGLKGKLTEEEYRLLQRAIVEKMTEGLDEKKPLKKEINLADLQSQVSRFKQDDAGSGGAGAPGDPDSGR